MAVSSHAIVAVLLASVCSAGACSIYLQASDGATLPLPRNDIHRSALLREIVAARNGPKGGVNVSVPISADLLEPLVELLGSDHVPSHFLHTNMLNVLPALAVLEIDHHLLNDIYATVRRMLDVPEGQYSSSQLQHQLELYAKLLGANELPHWFIDEYIFREALSNFRNKCLPGLTASKLVCSSKSVWGALHKRWFSDLPLGAVTKVDLRGNSLEAVLDRTTFDGFQSLRKLKLASNRISTIEDGAFSKLSSLDSLYLGDNQISIVTKRMFEGLSGLRYLALGRNQISVIRRGAFEGLTKLTHMILTANRISTLERDAFSGLSSLEFLYLDENRISVIGESAFDDLSSLRLLALRGNRIATITKGALDGLPSLRHLDFGENRISIIQEGTFGGLSTLLHLFLFKNRISTVEKGLFGGLSSLRILDLHENNISSVGKVEGLQSLRHLNLAGNQISTVETGAFETLPSLWSLRLDSNPVSSKGVSNVSE